MPNSSHSDGQESEGFQASAGYDLTSNGGSELFTTPRMPPAHGPPRRHPFQNGLSGNSHGFPSYTSATQPQLLVSGLQCGRSSDKCTDNQQPHENPQTRTRMSGGTPMPPGEYRAPRANLLESKVQSEADITYSQGPLHNDIQQSDSWGSLTALLPDDEALAILYPPLPGDAELSPGDFVLGASILAEGFNKYGMAGDATAASEDMEQNLGGFGYGQYYGTDPGAYGYGQDEAGFSNGRVKTHWPHPQLPGTQSIQSTVPFGPSAELSIGDPRGYQDQSSAQFA